jgi:flagellar biosynthesis/type III secretory pathway chaperone
MTTPSTAHEDLAITRNRLIARFTKLLTLLGEERTALVGRCPDTLAAVIERKEALCGEIAEDQQALLQHWRAEGSPQAALVELRELAERARTENALNGRIAHRARQTNRALLELLTGTADDLYDRPGPGRPAAPATGQHLGSA